MTYDSRPETWDHIHTVQLYLMKTVMNLQQRLLRHDQTKLHYPELPIFDEFTPKLKEVEFGSDEYKQNLEAMGPALDHHYSHNSHHPNYYLDGIKGMSLNDLQEMICDWMAAVSRQPNGSIDKSIEINQARYGFSDELRQILVNSVAELENGKS